MRWIAVNQRLESLECVNCVYTSCCRFFKRGTNMVITKLEQTYDFRLSWIGVAIRVVGSSWFIHWWIHVWFPKCYTKTIIYLWWTKIFCYSQFVLLIKYLVKIVILNIGCLLLCLLRDLFECGFLNLLGLLYLITFVVIKAMIHFFSFFLFFLFFYLNNEQFQHTPFFKDI